MNEFSSNSDLNTFRTICIMIYSARAGWGFWLIERTLQWFWLHFIIFIWISHVQPIVTISSLIKPIDNIYRNTIFLKKMHQYRRWYSTYRTELCKIILKSNTSTIFFIIATRLFHLSNQIRSIISCYCKR